MEMYNYKNMQNMNMSCISMCPFMNTMQPCPMKEQNYNQQNIKIKWVNIKEMTD